MPSARPELEELIREIVRDELRKHAPRPREARDEFLSTAEAARVAEVSPHTIRRWVKAAKLSRAAAGRELRISRAELEAFLRHGAREDEDVSPEQLAARAFG